MGLAGRAAGRRLYRSALLVVLLMGGVFLAYLGVRVVLGTDTPLFVVYSRSMVPSLDIGDIIVVRVEPFTDLRADDIIVFIAPSLYNRCVKDISVTGCVIVHRVVKIEEGDDGERVLTTKGDANVYFIMGIDYPIREENFIGKVIFRIPYLGYVATLVSPPLNYVFIAIIIAFLFLSEFFSKKKEGRQEGPLSQA